MSGCQALLEAMIAKRPQDRVADAGALLGLIRQAHVEMRRRGGIVDGINRLLPGSRALKVPMWLASMPMPSVRRTASTATILLVLVLVVYRLPQNPPPDGVSAMAAINGVPGSAEAQGPAISGARGTEATTEQAAESKPPSLLVSSDPADGGGLSHATAPSAAVDSAQPASAEIRHGSVEPVRVASAASLPEPEAPEVSATVDAQSEALAEAPTQPARDDAPATDDDPPVVDENDERVADWMRAADRALAANRLTTPADDNAYDHYRQVLDLDPDHAEAHAGLKRIADRYAAIARRALAANKLSSARLYTSRGLKVRSDHVGLRKLREELAAGDRLAAARPAPEPPKATAPPPAPAPKTVIEFDGTSVSSRGQPGSGNIIKDFKSAWRSVFN
jgi:hypothetical protein